MGKRGKMRSREMAVLVLNEVQMLDEKVAPAFPLAEERAHFVKRGRIDLAALRRARRPPASARRLVHDEAHGTCPGRASAKLAKLPTTAAREREPGPRGNLARSVRPL